MLQMRESFNGGNSLLLIISSRSLKESNIAQAWRTSSFAEIKIALRLVSINNGKMG